VIHLAGLFEIDAVKLRLIMRNAAAEAELKSPAAEMIERR
jgi:hypothetical protein